MKKYYNYYKNYTEYAEHTGYNTYGEYDDCETHDDYEDCNDYENEGTLWLSTHTSSIGSLNSLLDFIHSSEDEDDDNFSDDDDYYTDEYDDDFSDDDDYYTDEYDDDSQDDTDSSPDEYDDDFSDDTDSFPDEDTDELQNDENVVWYDELDESDEETDLSEQNVNPYSGIFVSQRALYNPKNQSVNDLIDKIARCGNLKSTEGDKLWEYDIKKGYYHPIDELEVFVTSCLETIGCRLNVGAKDIKNICQLLSWLPSIKKNIDDFNADKYLVNTISGIYDIRTEKMQEHSPDKLFTYSVDASVLDEDEISCPTFDSFCNSSLAPLYSDNEESKKRIIAEKRQLILEIIGYACSDSNDGKCAMFFKGQPDSGKSIMLTFVSNLFPSNLISNIPLDELSGRFNKAELYAKKLNISGEIKGKPLSEITTFKKITGMDDINAEYKGKNPFSFKPRCKMLFAGNALPGTTESDATQAFVNRLVVLLFNHSVPKEKQDKHLLDKLWNERDSIFTLSMHALRELSQRNFKFTRPEESEVFVQSFLERGNSLYAFLKDCCVLSPEARIHNTQLLAEYEKYCRKNELDAFTKRKLYEMLAGMPGVAMKKFRIGDKNCWGHTGIGLKKEI